MTRSTTRTLTALSVMSLFAGLSANDAIAQSVKEQLVGAWELVTADSVPADGSKIAVFGPNPNGTMIFSGGRTLRAGPDAR